MYIKVFWIIQIPITLNATLYFYMMFKSAFVYITLSLRQPCEVPGAGDMLTLRLKRLEQRG